MDKIYSRNNTKIKDLKLNRFFNDKKRFTILKFVIVFLIAIITAKYIINGINPIIDRQCVFIAKSIATKISNQQANIVMQEYTYDDFCKIVKDTNGNITLISANVLNVNNISSNIALKIQEALNNKDNEIFYIPLGSFTGSRFLAGRGINVEIKMSTIGNVETNLRSEFISSGINQTLHKIYLEVTCNVIVLTPFNSVEEKIVNQILLAEAVIVGITPNTYYNLEGLEKNEKVDIIE